jgi:diacylglycerol kinase family enzyme
MTSSPLRVSVILNEGAGTAQSQGTQSWRDRLVDSFAAHGVAASFDVLSGSALPAAAERAFQAARRGELDAIVVGGGDGSIRTVAGVVAGSDVPLGIIPLGTANHFARDLGLPLAPEEAVAVIAAANTRQVDVGMVNGEIFINNSSIGFYPYLVLARERKRPGSWLPKRAAMILALPQVIRFFPIFRLTVRVEGEVQPCRSPVVFIGNNEYQITLPATGTRQRLDRGELWICVANVGTWTALAWRACQAVLGIPIRGNDLRAFKGAAAEITSARHHVLVACDGEVKDMRPPLSYHNRPGALCVFAPRLE